MRLLNRAGFVITVVALLAMAAPSFAGKTTYKYDTLGRVIEVTYPDGKKTQYTYDSAGNRIVVNRT